MIFSKKTKKDSAYFEMAESIASLSKDENTKVGSVIVDVDGKVVSMGYNGIPSGFGNDTGITDKDVPHGREKKKMWLKDNYKCLDIDCNFEEGKHPFMIHSEMNAIITTSDKSRLKDATLYCTHYCCPSCAGLICQSGIKTVKVLDKRHSMFSQTIHATLYMFENVGVDFSVFEV